MVYALLQLEALLLKGESRVFDPIDRATERLEAVVLLENCGVQSTVLWTACHNAGPVVVFFSIFAHIAMVSGPDPLRRFSFILSLILFILLVFALELLEGIFSRKYFPYEYSYGTQDATSSAFRI